MKIAVLGMGKMGSWLARQLSESHSVAAMDVVPERAQGVPGVTALDSLEKLRTFEPEMVVNAVTLGRMVAEFEETLPFLPEGCLLADVASIKTGLPEFYKACGHPFVSIHPMFGPTHADLQALHEENVVLITESDACGLAFFKDFFSSRGLGLFEKSFSEHDELMAYSLTTPFVTSLTFASCVHPDVVPGTTFARHKELARKLLAEDDTLLCEVLFNPQSSAQIDRITGKLEFLKHVIRARDEEEAKKVFAKLRANLGD